MTKKKKKLRYSMTILKPALSPGQLEIFEQLKRCRNFEPNRRFDHPEKKGGNA